MLDRFISWLYTRCIYGVRCRGFYHECICCQKWKEHDEIFNIKHPKGSE